MSLFGQQEFSIDNFMSEFEGGAKSFLFVWEPEIKKADGSSIDEQKKRKRRYLVKSSSFPASNVEEIAFEMQGINFKMGGKRTYEDWNLQFNVDKNGYVRKEFEEWMQGIHKITDKENEHFYLDNYSSTQTFKMLKGDGSFSSPLLEIKLYNAWPKSIGPIALDYSSTDFAQFDVTFSYQYHMISDIVVTPEISLDLTQFINDIKSKISGLISNANVPGISDAMDYAKTAYEYGSSAYDLYNKFA